MKKYQDWARREYSEKQRFITLAFAAPFFLLAFPYLLLRSSAGIDRWLHLPRLDAGAANVIVGLLLVVLGFSLGLWSVYAQMTIGSGTPIPLVPTRRLVVKAPFTCCRNPMTLGTFVGYLGIAVWAGSLSAVAIVLLFTGLLLLYVKLVEEKELAARFGPEYLEYKRSTPFILPRLRRRS